MEERFFAVEGLEFGAIMTDEHCFVDYDTALEEFKGFFDANGYGSGIIYEVTPNSIVAVKTEFNS